MSDYGDDYSDYGDEFFYVEDEYMMADDLAEHAVNSPPPTSYGDEDALSDWDRFDYFNDLEYASDGYDDAKFTSYGTEIAKTGEKRKRNGTGGRGKKKQKKVAEGHTARPVLAISSLPPVIWRTQDERDAKAKMWDGNTESYALLKDWRDRHAGIPAWAAGSPRSGNHEELSSKTSKRKAALVSEPLSPGSDFEDDGDMDEDAGDTDEDTDIDPAVLLAALQNRLAAAGGPLADMDPQQMLQFAMRMMSNKDAGDDIAGEMADALLDQGEEDKGEDEEAGPTGLLSWLDKQRDSKQDGETATPESPEIGLIRKRPPTPPSSEANRSIRAAEETIDQGKGRATAPSSQNNRSLEVTSTVTRKRKADDDVPNDENSTNVSKRRTTRSHDAPTAASHAGAAPALGASKSRQPRRS